MNKVRHILSIGLATLAAVAAVAGIMLLGRANAAQAAPSETIQSMIDAAPDGGTVSIPTGTYTESLTVNKTITLTGVSSATTIIRAVTGQRVITVTAGHNLRLENLTVTGGHPSGAGGGGVYVASGNLQIVNCVIADNSASYGGGVFQDGSGRVDVIGSRIELNVTGLDGGGLYVHGSTALTSTQVLSNTAGRHGGGLHVDTGRADLVGGLFSNNIAGGNGGAVNLNNSISVTGTQFISNTANDNGGGLLQWNSGQQVNVTNVRFERNQSSRDGGGLWAQGSVTVTNSLLISNTADSRSSTDTYGGGAYVSGGALHVMSSTFRANQARCTGCSSMYGGGVYVDTTLSATVQGSLFENNDAWHGGGLDSAQAITIRRTTFQDNSAGYGGAASVVVGADIQNSDFLRNHAVNKGGGLEAGSGATLVGTRFISNAAMRGGGLFLYGVDVMLVNDVIADNQAWYSGSGLYVEAGSLRLLHTTIARNIEGDGSGAHFTTDWSGTYGSVVAMTNTILVNQTVGITVTAGNTATLNGVLWYSNTANVGGAGAIAVTNAITGTPAFAADGYHLTSISKATNAGIAAGVATDMDGELRDAAPDIGADEVRTCWARLNDNATDYGHVQAAVDASTRPTDTVKVAGYCPGVQARGGVTQSVYISKTMTIRGGYTTTNWTTPNPTANPTTLDALGRGRVGYIIGNITPTLDGLRLTNGSTTNDGGGLYTTDAHPLISGCLVYSNTAAGSGGGAYLYLSSNAILQGNQVYSNTAGLGGGGILLMSSSNAMLSSNQIHDNKDLNGVGGGVFVNSYAVRLNDDQIYRNTAGLGSGGGIYLGNSFNATLAGNRVYGNTADQSGGGLYIASSPTATLTNNQVYSNTATAGNGGGLSIGNSSAATLTSNQVYSNTSANDGGGVCLLTSANAALSGNTVYGNATSFGGGIYVGGGNAQLTRNQVYHNTSWYGGGVYLLNNSSTVLAANSIYSNTAAWYGGGIYLNASSSRLVNTVIANNQASEGSGLYIWGSSPQLLQTTLARNIGGNGVCVTNNGTNYSTAAMTNTILVSQTVGITVTAGNTATLNGMLWYGNALNSGGAGSINVQNALTGDPAFAADGYHLTLASTAAIDRGVNAGVTSDVDGEPRPMGAGFDLGADEFRWFTIYLPLVLRNTQ